MLSRVKLRHLHRLSALALGLFLAMHLSNHIAGLAGQAAHTTVLSFLRPIYRNFVVEPVLILLFFWQALSGLRLAWSLWRAKGRARLQALSGAYLAAFLLIHIAAVLSARLLSGTETDLSFAAAGLHAGGIWPWFFAPYYGLAVVALFAHLAVPIRRRFGIPAAFVTLALGCALAFALVLLLAGAIVPLTIPASLIAAFP
jgi:succinate dehydrogenase/fumarate reductase cytochrome b subunit